MQKRFFNWQDADKSDWVNRQHLAIMPPALYRGFDVKGAGTGGTTLVLSHTSTSYTEVDVNGITTTNKGVWISRQGVVIIEDAAVSIPVVANAVANPRIDLVVGEHVYIPTVGGSDAGYTTIQGVASATPVAPALTDASKQVIIGYLAWPASTSDVTNATYTRITSGMFGENDDYMFRSLAQIVSGSKRMQNILNLPSAPMTYSGPSNLTSAVLSNTYEIPNVDANYRFIDTITYPAPTIAGLNVVHIRTLQALELSSTVFIVANDVGGVGRNTRIDAGETFTLWDYRSNGGLIYLTKGGEANKSKVNKFLKQVMFNKAAAAYDTSGNVNLQARGGNYYELGVDFVINPGVYDIKTISGNDVYVDSFNTPLSKGGNLIFLRVKATNGTPSFRLITSPTVTAVAPYKAIYHPTASDIVLQEGAVVVLLEDETIFRVVSIEDTGYDIVKMVNDYLALNQNQEHIWLKTQTTGWTTLSASAYDSTLNRLVIPNTGNSFALPVPITSNTVTDFIQDILLDRGGPSPVAAPAGLIINIKFLIEPAIIPPFPDQFFILTTGGNITSAYTDIYRKEVSPTADKFTLKANSTIGHTVTFRKTNIGWEVIDAGTQITESIEQRLNSFTPELASALTYDSAWTTASGSFTPNMYRIGNYRKLHARMVRTGSAGSNLILTVPAPDRPAVTSTSCYGLMYATGGTGAVSTYVIQLQSNGNLIFAGAVTSDFALATNYYIDIDYVLR